MSWSSAKKDSHININITCLASVFQDLPPSLAHLPRLAKPLYSRICPRRQPICLDLLSLCIPGFAPVASPFA